MNAETNLTEYQARSSLSLNGFGDRKQTEDVAYLEPATINELYQARDILREFAVELGDMVKLPMREDVLAHCDKVKQTRKEIFCYERIEKMVKIRIQKMVKNKKIKRNWGQEDVYILMWVISKYSDFRGVKNVQRDLNSKDWSRIAMLIPGVVGEGCMFKWLSLKRNKLSDNCWSERESLLLDRLVKKYEEDWATISEQLYYLNSSSSRVYRCPKQCREHWNCYLNPKLKKGPWTLEEDIILLTEIRNRNGEKKWTELVNYLDGRTQNALKNRYNLIIDKEKGSKRLLKTLTPEEQFKLVNSFLDRHYLQRIVSNSPQGPSDSKKENLVKTELAEKQLDLKPIPEKRILRKRKNRKKMVDLQYESDSEYIEVHPSPQPILSTPRIHENHILQLNCLQSTPLVFNSHFQKLPQEHEFVSPYKVIGDFDEDLKKQNIIIESDIVAEKSKFKDEPLPEDFEKIQFVSLREEELEKFKELVLKITKGEIKDCSFVPCQISENKITKFSY